LPKVTRFSADQIRAVEAMGAERCSYVHFIICVILVFPANKSVANTRYSADSCRQLASDYPEK
jgi:hypothetical protein